MYHESIACDIFVSCMVLHNYCRDRNLEFSVDDDVKEMIRKENEVSVTRKQQENTSDKEAFKMGQFARNSVISSFMS